MSGLAFHNFFAILVAGKVPPDIAKAFGYIENNPQPVTKPVPQVRASDGALQILGILQRDSRLIDFLMEDIGGYSDEQVGAAVRNLHDQSRESLTRYMRLAPVIDGVEGVFTKLETNDPSTVKLLGNGPAKGKAPGGILLHKGWRAENIDLPPLRPRPSSIIAPAEA